MRNKLIVPIIIFAIGLYYLVRSGVQPDFTTVNYEAGVAFTVGGLFLFVDRWLTRDSTAALANEIRELREKLQEFQSRL